MTPAVERSGGRIDRGAAMVGTTAGVLVFLLLLFAAVQILFNLYATSMVTSAAHEAARHVAGYASATDRCAAVGDAEAGFVDALGEYGNATLTWDCAGPDVVSVRIVAEHPTVLPARMAGLVDLARMDRTIVVRIEEFRE